MRGLVSYSTVLTILRYFHILGYITKQREALHSIHYLPIRFKAHLPIASLLCSLNYTHTLVLLALHFGSLPRKRAFDQPITFDYYN
jgi:hypothetical protein